MDAVRSITPALARRIAVTRQRLAGPCLPSNSDGIMKVMRDLGWIQIDPMTTVTRSHLLVLWSRLGQYDPAHLSKLLWEERQLFEDWAHGASIVLMEDYPIFSSLKRTFATGQSSWAKRVHAWLKKNQHLRRRILIEIRRNGPLPTRHFEDESAREWHSTGWTTGRNVDQMLYILWAQGKIMVAGRTNGLKLWDLTERCRRRGGRLWETHICRLEKHTLSLDIRKLGFEALRIEAVAILAKKDNIAQRFTVLPTNDPLGWISEPYDDAQIHLSRYVEISTNGLVIYSCVYA